MRAPAPEQELKAQLARELCSILHGYQRDIGAACVDAHATELSRLRHGDLRRFSLARIIRYIARAGYAIEFHMIRTPRIIQHSELRCTTSLYVLRGCYNDRSLDVAPRSRDRMRRQRAHRSRPRAAGEVSVARLRGRVGDRTP